MAEKSKLTSIKEKTLNFYKSHRKLVGIFVVGLILVILGFKVFGPKKAPQEQYQTALAEKGNIVSTVSASGQILTGNIMSANTKASGVVKQVFVKDGDLVNKGDKILEINLDFQGQQKYSQAWASYQSAKNSLESAKTTEYTLQSDMFSKWDTFKTLAESDTYKDENSPNRSLPEFYIAKDNWLAAEAKYKNQQAVINQAQSSLNSSWLDYQLSSPIITAPTSGTITSLMYIEGMGIGTLDTGTSTSNQKVATIETGGLPIVSVNLSEIDVARTQLDQKATITLDSIPDKTFTGVVVGVDRIGQTSSGVTQYPALIKLDASSPNILPSMTATANIIVATKDNVLLVPTLAVQEQNGQSTVRVLNKGQIQQVPVVTGLTSDTQTEIVSGLEEGQEVVTGTSSTSGSSSFSSSNNRFGAGGGAVFRTGSFNR